MPVPHAKELLLDAVNSLTATYPGLQGPGHTSSRQSGRAEIHCLMETFLN
jgi:hypothetical protein